MSINPNAALELRHAIPAHNEMSSTLAIGSIVLAIALLLILGIDTSAGIATLLSTTIEAGGAFVFSIFAFVFSRSKFKES